MIGLKRGTVKLLPHHSRWAKEFEKEKKQLKVGLGNLIVNIQHVGSTAIPEILAKPIIDIDIGSRSIKDFDKCIKILKDLGYELRENVHRQNVHILFAKGPEAKRTHYIHIIKYGGEIWKRDISFRDYLTNHKKEAKRYSELKNKLAKQFPNIRGEYTKSKNHFIRSIISLIK